MWWNALPAVGGLFRTIFGDKAASNKQTHDERMAVYQQYAAEFGHSKTWWDSLIDGLNRLPRPLMTFGVIYLFWMCWNETEKFIEGTIALQAMPKEGWAILGIVITFWFGGKLAKDFGKYKPTPVTKELQQSLSESLKRRNGERPKNPDDDEHNDGITWEQRVTRKYQFND